MLHKAKTSRPWAKLALVILALVVATALAGKESLCWVFVLSHLSAIAFLHVLAAGRSFCDILSLQHAARARVCMECRLL